MATVNMVSPQGNYFAVEEDAVSYWEGKGYSVAEGEQTEKPKKRRARKAVATKRAEPEEGAE